MDPSTLIPAFGGTLWTIAAFVIALSVIVAVHEYGHYIVARWCGIRSEVFSIGFGPVLYARTDKRGTQWQIAALPFGGYVKFLGDASAASDKASDTYDDLDDDTKRHTMHGAPLWARAATVAAGPVFNFILSIFVFAGVFLWQGEAREPLEIGELKPLPVQSDALRVGDAILGLAGQPVSDFSGFYTITGDLPAEEPVAYDVRRDGQDLRIDGPFPFPALIEGVQPRSAAMDAGLRKGDVITHIDDATIVSFRQLQDAVGASDGAALTLNVWRAGEALEFTLAPRRMDIPTADGGFETRWLIGMTGGVIFSPARETPGIGASIVHGADQTLFIMKSSLSGLWHMITGAISSCNLSGPIGIAETSGAAASQGLLSFIWFIAVLSTAVGLLNLFPIPVLDGGHLVFHAYEAMTGRPPSDAAMRMLMGFGLSLMLALMVFALANDLFCP